MKRERETDCFSTGAAIAKIVLSALLSIAGLAVVIYLAKKIYGWYRISKVKESRTPSDNESWFRGVLWGGKRPTAPDEGSIALVSGSSTKSTPTSSKVVKGNPQESDEDTSFP